LPAGWDTAGNHKPRHIDYYPSFPSKLDTKAALLSGAAQGLAQVNRGYASPLFASRT